MSERRTGSWVVKRPHSRCPGVYVYLIGGPFVQGSIRGWLAWGREAEAYVFPAKKAAREVLRWYDVRGATIERSGEGEAA